MLLLCLLLALLAVVGQVAKARKAVLLVLLLLGLLLLLAGWLLLRRLTRTLLLTRGLRGKVLRAWWWIWIIAGVIIIHAGGG